MKSHNCHILMEYLLPITLWNALPAPVSSVLVDLSSFFHRLCSKSIDPQQLPLLQDHVVHTLCRMEIIFPFSFFTVMVHLTVHLVEEVRLSGPVHYRWMYPIERYLDNVESRINRPLHVDDRPHELMPDESATMFPEVGKAVGAASFYTLTPTEKFQAHRHVLVNCLAVEKYLDEFRVITKRKLRSRSRSQSHVDSVVHREFPDWFKHKNPLERGRVENPNSGVYVTSDTRSYASKRDSNVAVGSVSYYGKLVDIIELNYNGQFTVVLFRCIWANTTSGRCIKQGSMGHIVVNFSHPIHTGDREDDEPYILASETRLVYYVEDDADKELSVVVHVNPRDMFEMGEDIGQCQFKLSPQPTLTGLAKFDVEGLSLRQDDNLEELTIDAIDNCEEAAYLPGKLEEMDLFLCASSILFCKAMIEASSFSSLEHATSFARELWFNTLPIQSWLDTFSAHRHIGDAITIAHGDIRTALSKRPNIFETLNIAGIASIPNKLPKEIRLRVELDIASRKKFTLIERGLTKLWERLARENTQEVPEETGEIVQDSILEEDVVPDSSDEVVSKGQQPSVITFDLNKTPEKNDIC
ncbi:hypothetical protein Ahy_A03g013658 [Arachis hypogaea]|uniref:DUF4218 domain-containing protein n=1 Tax=Arachis hypogaea TaxID=3818 RepID=A0A445DVY5_ARAHY|nr:hypothetical protein Ahy_A03g013658 [Arachis hypogaea]